MSLGAHLPMEQFDRNARRALGDRELELEERRRERAPPEGRSQGEERGDGEHTAKRGVPPERSRGLRPVGHGPGRQLRRPRRGP